MGGKEYDAKGIATKVFHPADSMGIPIWLFYLIFTTVFTAIGTAVAYFVVLPLDAGAVAKVATLAELGLGWTYLGAFSMKFGLLAMGVNLGHARSAAKVEVPDQQCYQVKGSAGAKLGYVLMETEGAVGAFNRAQRGLQNFNETFTLFVVMYLLASFVFPFYAFVAATAFMGARVLGAVGYTSSADGRMGGNILGVLINAVMEGMVLVAGCKALMA